MVAHAQEHTSVNVHIDAGMPERAREISDPYRLADDLLERLLGLPIDPP